MGMEFEHVGLRYQWCLVVTAGLLLGIWYGTGEGAQAVRYERG